MFLFCSLANYKALFLTLLSIPVILIFIREYASTLYIRRNDSELALTQFKDPARIIFSHLRLSRQKFLFLKILFFSLLFQNFKSLPRKTPEIRPFTILAFSSGLFIIIIFFFFFIIRLNFYEAYLRNGAT